MADVPDSTTSVRALLSQPSTLDLSELSGKLRISIETENPVKLGAAVEKEAKDATVERWTKAIRDVGGFLAAIAATGVLIYLAISIIRDANASADDRKWATALLTGVVGSAVAFVLGKHSK